MNYAKISYSGLFLTFEGIEGCGKSTQAKKLVKYLQQRGYSVIHTKEPGGTALGSNLRKLVLCSNGINISREAELFLYAADRAQHVQEIILPALQDGKIIICDRFTDATVAYQGYARGVDRAVINNINGLATSGLVPNITILMDLAVTEGLARALARNQKHDPSKREDRFEQEGRAFHEKVRQGYLNLAKIEPDRIKVIDANKTIDQVHEDIIKKVLPLLKRG